MASKKNQIMQAALQLFVEQGFEATSTAAITRKAGVAAGTLFHHFESKEKLIDAIYTQVKSDMSDALAKGTDNQADARAMFHRSWKNFVVYCAENPENFRFVDVFSNSTQISNGVAERAKKQFFDHLHELIEVARRENCLQGLPDELIYSMITSLSVATVWHLIEHPEKLHDEIFMERALNSCWRAISNDSTDRNGA